MKGLRKQDLVDGKEPEPEPPQSCPRCESENTKFCYYNNYKLSQPRYYCKACKRYWTRGGSLRDIPEGGKSNSKRGGRTQGGSNSPNAPNGTRTTFGPGQINTRSQFYQSFRQRLINQHQLSLQQVPPTNLTSNIPTFSAMTSTGNFTPTFNINSSSAPTPLISSSLSPSIYPFGGGFIPAYNSMVPSFGTPSQEPPMQNPLHQSQQALVNQLVPSYWPTFSTSTTAERNQQSHDSHQNVISQPGAGYYLSSSTTTPTPTITFTTNTNTTTTTTTTTNTNTNTNSNINTNNTNTDTNNITAGPSLNPIFWPHGDLPAELLANSFLHHA